MIDRVRTLRYVRRAAILVAAAFGLAGCLDMNYDLTLHNDGSGVMRAKVVWSKEFTDFVKSSRKGKGSVVFKDKGPGAKTREHMDHGRLVEENEQPFANLAELPIDNSKIEVTKLGWSVFTGEKSRVHVFLPQQSTDGKRKPSEKLSKKELRDVEKIFGGHAFNMSMHLPCRITSADPLRLQGTTVMPVVKDSYVRWEVPMTALFLPSRGLDFNVICVSRKGIKPGATRN